MKKLLVLLTSVILACGGDTASVQNERPFATGFIDPIEIFVSERKSLTVTEYFSDPDGDPLIYRAVSMDTDNLDADVITNSLVVLEGLGATVTTVALTAADIHGAEVSIDVDVTVRDPIRDEFDTDNGWIGMNWWTQRNGIYDINRGHLIMNPAPFNQLHYARRDIGTFGPGWKVQIQVDKDAKCYGVMAFSEALIEGEPTRFIWSIDVDPYNDYIATLWLDASVQWIHLAEGHLPQEPFDRTDGYLQLGMGVTEDGVFYGVAHGDFKLFEFDMNSDLGLSYIGETPRTIEHIALTTGTNDPFCYGHVKYDWIEISKSGGL